MTYAVKSQTAVMLAGHLGDVVLHSCILKPIRERFPDDEIILIGSSPAMEIFGKSPYIDRAVYINALLLGPWRWLKTSKRMSLAKRTKRLWSSKLKVQRILFPFSFVQPHDIPLLEAIDAQEVIGHRDARVLRGEDHHWPKRITHPMNVLPPESNPHVFDQVAHFLTEVGCKNISRDQLQIEIDVPDRNVQAAESVVKTLNGEPYGVIFPGANFMPQLKMWETKRYGPLIAQLGEAGPRHWLVCGSRQEKDICDQVVEAIHSQAKNAQAMSLSGLPILTVTALVRGTEVSIGADNGGMHLTIACGRPAVSIVNGAIPQLYFPWGDPTIHRTVTHPVSCSGCRYHCTQPRVICIEDITAQTVADATLEVLQASGESRLN